MTDFDPGQHKPTSTDPDLLPTAYGGTTGVEPQEPGQSLGQAPDPDDADVDEAGDRPDESGSGEVDTSDIGYETPTGEREPSA